MLAGMKISLRAPRRHGRPTVRPPGVRLRSRPGRNASPCRKAALRMPRLPPRRKAPVATICAAVVHETKQPVKEEIVSYSAKTVTKFFGLACFALAMCSWMGTCSSLSRFASVAAQSAPSGINSMPAWTGLSAGFLHTLAGPDHLAGLAPLTMGQKQAAAASMGALWGFGHSSGQLLLGILFLVLKERFHGIVPWLSKWAGVVVGLTLIAIGVMGIYENKFAHHHTHADGDALAQVKGTSFVKRSLGTYAVGFVYGLQPDSLFVVLPALTLPTPLATLSYVVMFVIGTVCAMAGYTLAIGTASEAASGSQPWLVQHLSILAAAIALAVGVTILLPSLGFHLPMVS